MVYWKTLAQMRTICLAKKLKLQPQVYFYANLFELNAMEGL